MALPHDVASGHLAQQEQDIPHQVGSSTPSQSPTTAMRRHVSHAQRHGDGGCKMRVFSRSTNRGLSHDSTVSYFHTLNSDILLDSFGCIPYRGLLSQNDCTSSINCFAAPATTTTISTSLGDNGSQRRKSEGGSWLPSKVSLPQNCCESFGNFIFQYFAFLRTRHFWFLVELSLRATFVGLLPPAAIAAMYVPRPSFFPFLYTVPAVVLGVGTSFGQSANFTMQFFKAGCIWLPIATGCRAIALQHFFPLWIFVYALVLFLIGCFSENMTRRVSLLLFNISMVSQLLGDTELLTTSRIFVDWLIGVLFALVATLLPYPWLSTSSARSIIRDLFENSATAFRGLSTCFWSNSNTERSMQMVHVRHVSHTLDVLMEKMEEVERLTFYEFLLFDSCERRQVRLQKMELVNKLRFNLRPLMRVIDIVQNFPHIIDDSDRCIQFGTSLSCPMESISSAVEDLFKVLACAQERKDLLELDPLFETCGRNFKKLQDEFGDACRVILYEKGSSKEMEEFVPLMTFFVFWAVSFWFALDEFHGKIRMEQKKTTGSTVSYVWKAITTPFVKNALFLRCLFVERGEAEMRVVIEAAKVSVAMLIAVLFFYHVHPHSLLLSGPTIIAFVSGMNPVETTHASVTRFTGTLLGSVIGFFSASLTTTKVELIVSLCTITAIMTFFRTGQKYGIVCMYANFVAVSTLSLSANSTAEMVIVRIQQNTFAIMIYCLICVLVLPVSPGAVLMSTRIEVLRSTSRIVGSMMHFYGERNEAVREEQQSAPIWSSGRSKWLLGPEEGGDSKNIINFQNVLLPTFIAVQEPDPRILRLFRDVDNMREQLNAAANIMIFAADERGIAPRVYPHIACHAVQSSLRHIFSLVYIMACSWKLMYDKGYFTPEMCRILRYLQPISNDINISLHHFVEALEVYLKHPSSVQALELTKCLMEFCTLVDEFGYRKNCAILEIISDVVAQQRQREKKGLQCSSNASGGRSDHSGDGTPRVTTCNATHGGTGGTQKANRPSHTTDKSSKVQNTRWNAEAQPKVRSKSMYQKVAATETGLDGGNNIPQARQEQKDTAPSVENIPYGESGGECTGGDHRYKYFNPQQQHFREDTREVQSPNLPLFITPYLTMPREPHHHTPTGTSASEYGVHFTDSFVAPITVHDSEGLHVISLALYMLGKELKNVFLSFEEMIGMNER